MKKIILAVLGFSPLLFGRIISRLMMTFPNVSMPVTIIGLISLILWGYLGYFTGKEEKNTIKAFFIVHTPALAVLLLILYQEIVMRQYWSNIAGVYSQHFYLPFLSIGYSLTRWSGYVWPAYIACFMLMSLAFSIGYKRSKQRNREK